MKRLLILALVLGSSCTAVASTAPDGPNVEVHLMLSGATTGELALAHAVDAANGCRVSGAPAAHEATATGVVETPGGPPTYRVSATAKGVQFALSALPYRLGQPAFADASNSVLWLTTPQGVWALPTQAEPGVGIAISFASDGGSGTFRASGLVAMRDGAPDRSVKRLGVAGTWRCQSGGS